MSVANTLDKFYTNEDVAVDCWKAVVSTIGQPKTPLIEPSAGGGSFLRAVESTGNHVSEAYDIDPEYKGIEQADFLSVKREYDGAITIGNPPFGHRCRLAIDFFNYAAEFSDAVCFVIPVTFAKWSVQNKLDDEYKLVYSRRLEDDSFNEEGKPYSIRCLFQIWVRRNGRYDKGDVAMPDMRLQKPPAIAKDGAFIIWQHNATEQSRKYVDEPWEIAVWRQGYKDYTKRFHNPDDYDEVRRIVYNTNQQLFFIKPLTEHAREVINHMDFDELAKTNLFTPGFGKKDFVWCYEQTEKAMEQADENTSID